MTIIRSKIHPAYRPLPKQGQKSGMTSQILNSKSSNKFKIEHRLLKFNFSPSFLEPKDLAFSSKHVRKLNIPKIK